MCVTITADCDVCVCVWCVFGLVTCRDCWLQFSCLFFLKVFKDIVYSMGRKPGVPFPHLEPTQPYWHGSKLFSQGDRTERLGLGLGSMLIRLFRLKEVEGIWRFFSYVFFFTFLNLISQTAEFPFAHWFGLRCQGKCEFTVMASLKCKEVEKGMCDPEKCKNISDIRHNLPMSRSREFWIQ